MPAAPEALVDAGWIAAHLGDPELRILHVANDRAEYDAGHVHGAVYAHGYDDFTENREFRALVPLPKRMAATLGRLGVSPAQRIVCTAGARSPWPARAYWVLRYYRFPRGPPRRRRRAGSPRRGCAAEQRGTLRHADRGRPP